MSISAMFIRVTHTTTKVEKLIKNMVFNYFNSILYWLETLESFFESLRQESLKSYFWKYQFQTLVKRWTEMGLDNQLHLRLPRDGTASTYLNTLRPKRDLDCSEE